MTKSAALLLAAVSALFVLGFSYPEKMHFWGERAFVADGTWRSLAEHSYNFLVNALTASDFFDAVSLNFQVPGSPIGRSIYASYPQGFLILPYFYFKIRGALPTVESLYAFSLLNQGVAAFLFSSALFMAIRGLCEPAWIRFFLAAAAQAVFFFFPPSYFWYGQTWWPDVASLTSVSLLLFWEMIRPRVTRARLCLGVDFFVLFLAACTDWFSVLVAGAYFLLKFDRKNLKATLIRAFGIGAGLAFYLIPVLTNEWGLASVIKVFLKRANVTATVEDGRFTSLEHVWRIFSWQLTPQPVFFYVIFFLAALASGTYFYRRWRSSADADLEKAALVGFLLTVPMILHAAILSQHYVHHPWEFTKFTLPASALAPVFLPALIYRQFHDRWKRGVLFPIMFTVPALLLYALFTQVPAVRAAVANATVNAPEKYLDLCRGMEKFPRKFLYLNSDKKNAELRFAISFVCRKGEESVSEANGPKTVYRRYKRAPNTVAFVTQKNSPPPKNWLPFLKSKVTTAHWDIYSVTWPEDWLNY